MQTKRKIAYTLNRIVAPRVEMPPGNVLAVINNKGGVGKTTTAVSLAAALAVKHRVLLIDLDSQCSATISVGSAPAPEGTASLADMLIGDYPLRRLIQPTAIEGLDLVPGSPFLGEAQLRMVYQRNPAYRLRRALERDYMAYTFVILDCPPSFSLVSHNALLAADLFIVPVVPTYLAVEGMRNLFDTIDRMEAGGLPVARLGGIILTMVDYRTRAARETAAAVRERFGATVFHTEIPTNVRLAEAPASGRSIFEHAAGSRGAQRYWQLSKELSHRVIHNRTRRMLPTPASLATHLIGGTPS